MQTLVHAMRDPIGLHARLIGHLIELLGRYDCQVTASNGEKTVNALNLLEMLTLKVAHQAELTLCFDGPDESEARDAAAELVDKEF